MNQDGPPFHKQTRLYAHLTRTNLLAGAPADFVQAVGCLLDDRVAERAYEEIYRCAGEGFAAKLKRWVGGWR